MKRYQIAASILAADFARLGSETQQVIKAGADLIHFDVMDNHYVPNLTIGPDVCRDLKQYGVAVPIDVHLMTKPVDGLIQAFAEAGADMITIHPEATEHLDRSLQLIRHYGCQAGLAINPGTSLECLHYQWHHLSSVLIMTVNPGFGGQQFIEPMIDKIQQLSQLCDSQQYSVDISVDGGIKQSNVGQVAYAGANRLVIGSGIFKQPDYQAAIAGIRDAIVTSTVNDQVSDK